MSVKKEWKVDAICIAGLLVDYGIRAVAVAHGSSKAHCHMAGQAGYGPPIAKKAVDTGAGDGFRGNFLACLLRQGVTRAGEIHTEQTLRAMRWGHAAAGDHVRRSGANPGMPFLAFIQTTQGL